MIISSMTILITKYIKQQHKNHFTMFTFQHVNIEHDK